MFMNLLDFKKSAYELLSKIGDRSNPKIFRRLAIMKEYAEDWETPLPSQA